MPEKMRRLKVSRHWYSSDPQSTYRVEMKYRECILRVHTEWRLPISGGHPIMMEKSALAEGWGCTPIPSHCVYHRNTKLQCTLLLRGQILYPIFTLWSHLLSARICKL